MRTDNLFYQLFQILPEALFELIDQPSQRASDYQFTSVEVKELSRTIDGLFTTSNKEYPIYFVEVQFQRDENFYYRLITEIYIYLGQYKPGQSWQAVVLWAKRNIEPTIPKEYDLLFEQNLIKIIYLDEIEPTSLGLGIIDLVTSPQQDAPQKVKLLTKKAKEFIAENTLQRDVVELIERIIIYKFPQKSSKELEDMFGLAEWKQTQFYKDVRLEGLLEGEAKGLLEGKLETVPLLLNLGLSPETIARELDLDIEIINQEISKLSAN